MGQSESSNIVKRFVNKPEDLVFDSLQGLLWTNAKLCVVGSERDVKIVARADWEKDQVAVITGGGAGHEPADIGLVGAGLLTAAVCGEIFTAPPPDSVSRLLLTIVGPKGCVVVIRNHFCTALAVKAGIRNAERHQDWPLGAQVRIVTVADDVATSEFKDGERNFKNARGVAGIMLVMKVAGAAAAEGLTLDQVYEQASAMASLVRTQGVCFTSCSVPGQNNERLIPPDEMEVGCGIHGEVSRTRVKAKVKAKEIVQIMVEQLRAAVDLTRTADDEPAPLVACLNNLGSVPPNEMWLLTNEVMTSSIGPRIKLFVGPACFVTSLDTNGISLTVAPLQGRLADLLCAPTSCRHWLPAVVPSPPMTRPLKPERVPSYVSFVASNDSALCERVVRVCKAVLVAEKDLNRLDGFYKNGDCGRNLAHAARLLEDSVGIWPLACPTEFCECLASLLRRVEGALMALFSIFFYKASGRIQKGTMWEDTDVLLEAFLWALHEVQLVAEFEEGMRTFADALGPALRAGRDGGDLCDMAEAALKGARATAFMEKACGRSAHAAPNVRQGYPDTGAMAVAFVMTVMAGPEGKITRIDSDVRLQETYELSDQLASGNFGAVFQGVRRADGCKVAIKKSARRGETGLRSFEDLDFVERQRMLNWLFHKKSHIVNVHEALASPASVFLIMDLLEGSTLAEWLAKDPAVTEPQVANLMKQMLLAAESIHRFGLVHRDLKADNFVFKTQECFHLQLVDVVGTMQFQTQHFDSKVVEAQKKLLCGTGPYLSPEALVAASCPASDIWALGVTMYLMVTRQFPFQAATLRDLDQEHKKPRSFDGPAWLAMSQEGRQFAAGLLEPDPRARPTASEALQHSWFVLCEGMSPTALALPVESSIPEMQMPQMPITRGMSTFSADAQLTRQDSRNAIVKTLFLVRHGEALHNIEEKRAKEAAVLQAMARGASPCHAEKEAEVARKTVLEDEALKDAALSLNGKVMALNAQARINQLWSNGFPKPTCVLVSPLERTLQTAALIFPGHPNTHVVEALRERRTGLPCDERKRAQEVAWRSTFQHMSFENLLLSENGWVCPPDDRDVFENKQELRERCDVFAKQLASLEDDVLAIVTHKGFLRELERGPLGRADATEFSNCEVRVYDVTFPLDGGELVAHIRVGDGFQ